MTHESTNPDVFSAAATPDAMRWRVLVWRFGGVVLICIGVLCIGLCVLNPLGNDSKGTLSPLAIAVLRIAMLAVGVGLTAAAIPIFRVASQPGPPRVTVHFKSRPVCFEHVWVEQPWPAIVGRCETIDCEFPDIIAAEVIDGPQLVVLTTRGKITVPNWLENFDLLVACMLQIAEQRRMPLAASRRLQLTLGILATSIAGGLIWAGIQFAWF